MLTRLLFCTLIFFTQIASALPGRFLLNRSKRVSTITSVNNFSLSGGTLKADFTFSRAVEKNLSPVAKDIAATGTLQEGQTISVSFTFENPTSSAAGSHELKIYKASSQQPSTETLVTTITGSSTLGSTVTFTNYTVTSSEVGFYLLYQVIPKVSSGITTSGNTVRSQWTSSTVIAATTPLSVINRTWTWAQNAESDWNTNSGAKVVKTEGSSGNAFQSGNAPDWAGSSPTKYLDFDNTNSERIQQPVGTTMGSTFTVILLLDVQSLTSNRIYWGGSSTVYFGTNGGTTLTISQGTAQGSLGSPATGKKLYRVQFSGATSFLQLNKGSKTTVAATAGTNVPSNNSNSSLMSNYALNGGFTTGKLYAWAIHDGALSDAEYNAIYDYVKTIHTDLP